MHPPHQLVGINPPFVPQSAVGGRQSAVGGDNNPPTLDSLTDWDDPVSAFFTTKAYRLGKAVAVNGEQ